MRAKAPVPGSTRVSGLASAYSRRRATRSSRLACSGRENRGSRQYLSVCRPGSLRSTRDLLADAHDGLLVRRLDREAHHHRHVVGLAELEGEPREVVALLAVGGLEHRHAGDAPEVAVVLLGHAAAHAGVAGDDHDEAAADAGVHAS